jgi:organic hydroperoxide reductase OsmC/OhrA
MQMEPRTYKYESALRWTEAHKGILSSEGFPDVDVACPPEWGGHEGYWTPEHLLVAAVEVCIMTTFLSIAERRQLKITSYSSKAAGDAQIVNKSFRFSGISIFPEIVLCAGESVSQAKAALEKAHKTCMVSNSLSTPVRVHPKITLAEEK